MKKLLLALTLGVFLFTGCKKDGSDNVDPNTPIVVKGCMDPMSLNYNPDATVDDGNCQYLTSSKVEKRKALLEEYTGVRCTYCPDGHRRAQSFADANSGKVVLINVHTGGYANPTTGWPDYTTIYGAALASKAGMGQSGTGYPGGSVNRNTFEGEAAVTPYKMAAGTQYTLLNRGGWWNSAASNSPAGDIILAKDAPVNIGLKVKSYNDATREVKLMVEMYFTETLPAGAKLNIALLESNVVGRQIDAGVYNNNYVHKHMLRDLLTGQWGQLIDAADAVKGKRVQKEFTYTLAAKDKNNNDIVPTNCDFAAFMTATTNNDILNAAEIPLK